MPHLLAIERTPLRGCNDSVVDAERRLSREGAGVQFRNSKDARASPAAQRWPIDSKDATNDVGRVAVT